MLEKSAAVYLTIWHHLNSPSMSMTVMVRIQRVPASKHDPYVD